MKMSVAVPVSDGKLSGFSISTFTYKVVDGHQILVDVLVPKSLLELGPEAQEWNVKRPLLVRIHGGFLVRIFLS